MSGSPKGIMGKPHREHADLRADLPDIWKAGYLAGWRMGRLEPEDADLERERWASYLRAVS